MRNNNKIKKGSITILIIYIFVIVSIFSIILIHFALLQSSLSKNQLKKTQEKYNTENYLNKIIYDDNFVDDYLRDKVYILYRKGHDESYGLDVELKEDSRFDGNLKYSEFRLRNIYEKVYLQIKLILEYDNIERKVIAYGPCFNDIYSTGKCLLEESKLNVQEKKLFREYIDILEEKNLDYDYGYRGEYSKPPSIEPIEVKEKENLVINLGDYRNETDKLFSEKIIDVVLEDKIKRLEYFNKQNLILDLRRCNNCIGKTLTIGSRGEEDLIKMRGALYIEGDLIINQDFEFQGIIVINGGSIIVNTDKKPKIEGMLLLRGEPLDASKLELVYNQQYTHKAGSFLPEYFDLRIDTIKSY